MMFFLCQKKVLYVLLVIALLLPHALFSAEKISYIKFAENKNQWDTKVLYKADLSNGALFLERNTLTYNFFDRAAIERIHMHEKVENPSPQKINYHSFKVKFLNANPEVLVSAQDMTTDYLNYFIGKDKTHWASNVRQYRKVIYNNLYSNIDLQIYENDNNLKYDYIIVPGGDASAISLLYQDVSSIKLKQGNLVVKTSVNELTEMQPYAYQEINGKKIQVPCEFRLKRHTVSFVFPKGYNKKLKLVIDPTLVFSTFSGSTVDNWGFTATFDKNGKVYSGGVAFGNGYPTTAGAYQMVFGGGEMGFYLMGCDIAIIKYNESGTSRIYATYLGGSGNDLPHSLVVNASDELVIYGTTGSLDFPVTPYAFDTTFNGGDSIAYDFNSLGFRQGLDIIVAKLNSSGTQLLASTYIGGSKNDGLNDPSPLSYNYADGARGEVIVDDNNNIYIASTTFSPDFPVTSNSFQPLFGGTQDGCVLKIDNSLSQIIWSSFLGGTGADAIYSIVLDKNENIVVAGGTNSTDFPITPGVLYPSYMGGVADGFITQIKPNGNSILRSTYYGSSTYDQTFFVRVDHANNMYVFGQTKAPGNTFIFNAAWATPNSGQFISKLNNSMNQLIWSTAFGTGNGMPNISPTAFLVDLCNKIYLSGWGGFGGPSGTQGLPVTPDAFQPMTDNADFYLLVINDDASAQVYGTFFGGPSSAEHVDGGTSRFDKRGRIYQSVCAGCGGNSDFPTTPEAWSNTNNNYNCNNGVFKMDFGLPTVLADFDLPPVGCAPYTAHFNNTSSGGVTFHWSFGDGGTSTAQNPDHTYTLAGTYVITLIASDSATCNTSDTISRTYTLLSNNPVSLPAETMCLSNSVQIGYPPTSDTSITYTWSPTTFLTDPHASNPYAAPPVTTTYTVVVSNGFCTASVSQVVTVVNLSVNAGNDTTVCETDLILRANSYGNADYFIWSSNVLFGDTLNTSLTDSTISLHANNSITLYIKVGNASCEYIDSVKIITSRVDISDDPDKNICVGDSISIAVYNLNPANFLSYLWSPATGIVSGANTATPLVKPAVTTTYIADVQNQFGCTKKDTVVVRVSVLSLQLNSTSVHCYSECNGSLEALISGGTTPLQYQWNNGDNNGLADSLCAGTYSVTVTDFYGCKINSSGFVDAPAVLISTITESSPVVCNGLCNGHATVVGNGGTLPYTYHWSDGQAFPLADSLCGGIYFVTVTDTNGCKAINSVDISDTSAFAALMAAHNNVSCFGKCDGQALVNANFGALPYQYLWSNGGNTALADSLCMGACNVKVTDANNCVRMVFVTITEPAKLTSQIVNETNVSCNALCDGAAELSASGGIPNYQYLWSNGAVGSQQNNLCAGNYFITISDLNQCETNDTIHITQPVPYALAKSATHTKCETACNGTASITTSGNNPPYTYSWSSGQTTASVTNLCPGLHHVTITDANNCVYTDTVEIHSSSYTPSLTAVSDSYSIYAGENTQLKVTPQNNFTFLWSPSIGIDNTTIPNPNASPNSTIIYTVTGKDNFGCIGSDTVKISVMDVVCGESDIYIPNAFTPNGDNKNDVLYVRGRVISILYFSIFDRWGEKVFDTTDLKTGWDGRFRGKDLDPGVFVYYMEATCINGQNFFKKGNVTLIR